MRLVSFNEFLSIYVSSYEIICRPDNKIMTTVYLCNGYLFVDLYNIQDLKYPHIKFHRLVIVTFHYRDDVLKVNHKDGTKTDNINFGVYYSTR